ncbi:MAG: MFS transporter [bacterium]|nr:MFS transporter [bacterium]
MPENNQDPKTFSEIRLLAAVACGIALAPLNSTMIMLALPEFQASFNIGVERVGWLVIFYLVAMASLQIVTGKIGDNIGRRIPIVGGLFTFALVSIGAALSSNFWTLLLCRTLQAVAIATVAPNGFALIREVVPKERRATRFGILGATASLAATVGPPLGGAILQYSNWRYMFYFSVLMVVISLALGWNLFAVADKNRIKKPFDFLGSLLFTAFLVLATLLLTQLKTTFNYLIVVGGFVLLSIFIVFVRHVNRLENPILQLKFFRVPSFSIGSLAIALSNLAMYSVLMTIPILLSKKEGWEHVHVGMLLTSLSVAMMIMSPLGGKFADKFGRRRPVIAGLFCLSLGTIILLFNMSSFTLAFVILGLILAGMGIGVALPGLQTTAIESVSAQHAGSASGIISTSRYFGSIVGSIAVARFLAMESQWVYDGFSVLLMVVAAASLSMLICLLTPSFGAEKKAD